MDNLRLKTLKILLATIEGYHDNAENITEEKELAEYNKYELILDLLYEQIIKLQNHEVDCMNIKENYTEYYIKYGIVLYFNVLDEEEWLKKEKECEEEWIRKRKAGEIQNADH